MKCGWFYVVILLSHFIRIPPILLNILPLSHILHYQTFLGPCERLIHWIKGHSSCGLCNHFLLNKFQPLCLQKYVHTSFTTVCFMESFVWSAHIHIPGTIYRVSTFFCVQCASVWGSFIDLYNTSPVSRLWCMGRWIDCGDIPVLLSFASTWWKTTQNKSISQHFT